jgi:protein involved in sex pheromone biosynthesis
MLKKLTLLFTTTALLSACSSTAEYSTAVKSMQRKDKSLSCKEILLEMNEADFYRKTAVKKRSPKLKNLIMPLGYISTYMSAEDAIDASEARVAYLDQIYEIMHCADQEKQSASVQGVYLSSSSSVAPEYVVPTSGEYYAAPQYQYGYVQQ